MNTTSFRDKNGAQLDIEDSKVYDDGEDVSLFFTATCQMGMDSATILMSKSQLEVLRNLLIELLPMSTDEAHKPQLSQLGEIVVDSRPLPMTINVTGNVYINQVEKGE